MKNEKVMPVKVETVNAEIIQNELVNGLVNYLNSEADKVPAKPVKAAKDAKRHTDKELREISKGADTKGTFKIVRFELLESDTSVGLDPIHRAILVATKSNSAVYKLLTEKCTKLGKAKDKFNRLSILRALNNYESELQVLTAK